ncbi:MAG: very short patch repair endonuclease [Pedosphaera sp.]|nr:very short patch repair endonuclease [Pedosphaera sp.]
MPDVFTKAKRSQVMARIRGHGNKETELALIRIFRAHRITGWRRHQPVFGKPDFVFPKLRLAVFVDGCFWHGCPKHGTRPKQNRKFWDVKIARNKARDREVGRALRKRGWRVVRIWEHALAKPERVLNRLFSWEFEAGSPERSVADSVVCRARSDN